MGSRLKLRTTHNKDEIFEVLGHPEIWPLVSKREPDKELIPTRPKDIYLMVHKGKTLIACVYFEVLNGFELEMHPYVLPEQRKGNSYKAVRTAMTWAFNQMIQRIIVQIPDDFPNVLNFARRIGFEHIDKNTLEMRFQQWAAL